MGERTIMTRRRRRGGEKRNDNNNNRVLDGYGLMIQLRVLFS